MTHMMSSKSLSVSALCRSEATADSVRAALGPDRAVRCSTRVGPLAETAGAVAQDAAAADLVIVDLDLSDRAEIDALDRLISGPWADVPVVVTAPDTDLAGLRRLMRLGIADVVPQPVTRADLLAGIQAAQARRARTSSVPPDTPEAPAADRRPARRGGLTVAVLKAGGGCGATTVAVHVAAAFARRANRPRAVGLVDLDMQFGTCGLFLDMPVETSAVEVLRAGRRLDADMLRAAVQHHRSGLDLLGAPDHVVPLDEATPEAVERLAAACRDLWGCTVIDLPSAWTDWTRTVLEQADVVLLVMQMSVPAIHQAARQLETLAAEGLSETPVIGVVNRSARGLFGRSDMVKSAEKTLGIPLTHLIPSDWKAVSAAVDAGETLFEARQARPARKAVEDVVKAVLAAARRTETAASAG
ncbi:CpaE family protein [Caenispirillum salinarum]|uniref:AAA family ATPase n=1 Tax=Caenispirillum salinarum TaxID=859058 RepID=UPI00384F6912